MASALARTAEAVASSAVDRRARAADPAAVGLSRRPAAWAWPAPSASSSPRPSPSWCCPPRWCSSAAGSSGRGCRTSATPCSSTPTPRCGTASATPWPAARAPSSSARSSPSRCWRAAPSASPPASTRPTSSSRSPRRSRPPSASASPSRPARATRSRWSPATTPSEVLAAVEAIDGVELRLGSRRSGDGVARIDAVPDAAARQRRGPRDRGRRPRRGRRLRPTPTSVAATPRRSTRATTPPRTG